MRSHVVAVAAVVLLAGCGGLFGPAPETPVETPTATPTATATATPTASPTASPTPSPTPTAAPTPSPTATPTASPTPTPTEDGFDFKPAGPPDRGEVSGEGEGNVSVG